MTRDSGAESLAPEEIVLALGRVLASPALAGSARSRSFLAYVVTEAVAGRGDRLSERTVGRRALERPDDFDGRFDASVRVRALRVRKALETYYATTDDPVRIVLAAGTYAPTFERAHDRQRPRVETAVVVTTSGADETGLAQALSQELVRQCGAFPGLQVLGPTPATAAGPVAVASRLGVRFALDVSVAGEDGSDTVKAIVVDATSHAIIWGVEERVPAQEAAGLDVTGWARRITGQIGDYTGVIFARSAESHLSGEDEWHAMQAYYLAFIVGERKAIIDATTRLNALVASGHRMPTLVAALAHCRAVSAGYGFSVDTAADLRQAYALADEALQADPLSSTAHLALATAALVGGDLPGAVDNAARAAALAPNHPSTLGTAGSLTAYAGEWDAGLVLIRRALHLNPAMPSAIRCILVLDHLFAGDDALALAEASLITVPSEAWGPYHRALALMGLGYRERALAEMDAALAIDPSALDDIQQPVEAWAHLTAAQTQLLTERLRMFSDARDTG